MHLLEETYQFIFSRWYWAFLYFYLFFSALYFVGAIITIAVLQRLLAENKIHPIQHNLYPGQIKKEIRQSLISIFVFSLQAIPFQWLVSKGYFTVSFVNAWHCLWQIPLLFLWNEVHFYGVHWLLHRRWWLKNVHYMHHQSKEPTAFSTFSFHWVEAFLLGTVIFLPLALYPFHIFSVLSLPVMSIVLNLIGHCNHESETQQDPENITRFTYRHTMHHKWSQGNFGFMLPWLDHLFKTSIPKNQNQ